MNKVLDETGLNDKQRRAIRDYYVPNSPYKDSMDAESLQIEQEKYDLVVKLYIAMTSTAFLQFSKEVQAAICKKFVEDYQGARKKRETHTRNLPNGNIDMGDGNFSWIDNQGKLAVIGITLSILFAHYATPKEAGYRETCDPHHRGDLDNISLRTITTTTDKHSIYQTAKANGVEPPDWDTINTSECADKAVVVDADSINMNLPSEECKDEDGNAISGPRQLDMQRRQFAESSNFSGTNNVKKEEYSQLLNLSTILFNILIIKATTGRPAVMVAVGTHSKKLIQKKGERAFTTSCLYYVGWTYHPQSTNQVRVTILTLLRISDTAMAIFKTLGVFLRPVVNFYAEYRCNGKFSGKQLKEINDSIGQIGHEYATIVDLIEHHREANWETDLNIFKSIKPTLKKEVSSSAITGYEKILVLNEQVDVIAAKVDRLFNEKGGVMTKKDIFESIKEDDLNSLSSSSRGKVERMYIARLAFEKQREDVKTVYAELKEAKEALQGGASVDIEAFKHDVRSHNSGISEGALAFLEAGEKHHEDVKTIYAELKKAKEALQGGASVDIEAFKDYIRTHHSGISEGALDFVFGGEMHHEDVKTVFTKLQKANAEAAASGQPIDNTAALAQIRSDNHGLEGAVNFVAGGEKQNEDVKTVFTKLKETNAEAAALGQPVVNTAALAQIRSDNHELGGAVNFVLGCQKFHDEEHIIAAALESLHPYPTHEEITDFIKNLPGVSSKAKIKAIMQKSPLFARRKSLEQQIERLKSERNNFLRRVFQCMKCKESGQGEEGKIIVFGHPKDEVKCPSCRRRGKLTSKSSRSDNTTFYSLLRSAPCSLLQAEDELKQLKEEYKQCELKLKLETTLTSSSVSALLNTPEPLQRITYEEQYESECLGTCNEKGGTIKSVATCDDGSYVLHVVFDQVEDGERWISSRDDKLTIQYDLPKFRPEGYWQDERLADLLARGTAQLELSSARVVTSDEESETSVSNELATTTKPTRKRKRNSSDHSTMATLHSSVASPPPPSPPMNDEYFNPEFDDYLQEVLWRDEAFVRAIDEIHQEASKKVSTRLVSVLLYPFSLEPSHDSHESVVLLSSSFLQSLEAHRGRVSSSSSWCKQCHCRSERRSPTKRNIQSGSNK